MLTTKWSGPFLFTLLNPTLYFQKPSLLAWLCTYYDAIKLVIFHSRWWILINNSKQHYFYASWASFSLHAPNLSLVALCAFSCSFKWSCWYSLSFIKVPAKSRFICLLEQLHKEFVDDMMGLQICRRFRIVGVQISRILYAYDEPDYMSIRFVKAKFDPFSWSMKEVWLDGGGILWRVRYRRRHILMIFFGTFRTMMPNRPQWIFNDIWCIMEIIH